MRAFRGVTVTGATASLERTVHYLLHTVLSLERAPHDVELRVHFVPVAHMHQLNADHKGGEGPTDVLTFTPAGAADTFVNDLLFGEMDGPEEEEEEGVGHGAQWMAGGGCPAEVVVPCSRAMASASPLPVMRSELVDLGDIFVSLEYMQRRCAVSRSLPLVPYFHAAMVHATLHALGYDHTTPEELQRMVRREQRLGLQIAALSRRCPGFLPPLDVWDTEEKRVAATLW